ncbi:hypothetical protein MTsPCn9_10620 [Croceitalea sp. MTPC9]|nr:hypothetical protein MTsPCn6_26620 [Croceitalea sp. MTPC6]GMN16126.1 hypothetical protein MTsPCn9_10620 [Croceitalea sp. MTPC9]
MVVIWYIKTYLKDSHICTENNKGRKVFIKTSTNAHIHYYHRRSPKISDGPLGRHRTASGGKDTAYKAQKLVAFHRGDGPYEDQPCHAPEPPQQPDDSQLQGGGADLLRPGGDRCHNR